MCVFVAYVCEVCACVCVCVSRSAFDNNCLPLSFSFFFIFYYFLPATPFFIALQTAAPVISALAEFDKCQALLTNWTEVPAGSGCWPPPLCPYPPISAMV